MKTFVTSLVVGLLSSVFTWNIAKLPQKKETRQRDVELWSTAHRISGIAYLYESGELGLARMVTANQLSIYFSETESTSTRDRIGREIVGFYDEINLDVPSSFISSYTLPNTASAKDFNWIKEWVLRYPQIRDVERYSESEEIRKYEAPNTAAQTTASPSSGL